MGGDPNIYQWVRIPIYTSGWYPHSLVYVGILAHWYMLESSPIGIYWDPHPLVYIGIPTHWYILGSPLTGIYWDPVGEDPNIQCIPMGEDSNIYQWVGIPIYTSGWGSQYIPVSGDPNIYQWVGIPIYTSGWGSQYTPVGEDPPTGIYWDPHPLVYIGILTHWYILGSSPTGIYWDPHPIYTSGWGSQYIPVGEDLSAMIYQ
jgi:hypothetical protein